MDPGELRGAEIERLALDVIEALNRGDAEALLSLVHADYEFRSRLVGVEGRLYRGPSGFNEYFRDLGEGFTDVRWELEKILDAGGGSPVVVFRIRARGRGSGAPVDALTPQVWTFRDGRVWRADAYRSLEEALDAAGRTD